MVKKTKKTKKTVKKASSRKGSRAASRPPETRDVLRRGELQVTVTGNEDAVRRALTFMSFQGGWNKSVTRQIALDATLVADVTLDDKLGGPKVAMFSQDVRDVYRQRCVNEAKRLGHPVPIPSDIPAGKDTTVMEVGDELFEHALA